MIRKSKNTKKLLNVCERDKYKITIPVFHKEIANKYRIPFHKRQSGNVRVLNRS